MFEFKNIIYIDELVLIPSPYAMDIRSSLVIF